MPPHNGLRPDDGYGIKDARIATIEPDEQSTIDPPQMWSVWRLPLQNIELMTQYDKLRLQLLSRPEAVAQHANEKEADCNHLAIMF
jgi:hypothetical protein